MSVNDSLIEIALREMRSKRKPRTLAKITKDVFEVKGINPKENSQLESHFIMDFMLSGHFICCGEDKNGVKLWDLKSRQPSSLLDKDGSYLEEFYDDEEVAKNELKDETILKVVGFNEDDDDDDDDDIEIEERDEIEEELEERDEIEEGEEIDLDEEDFLIEAEEDEDDDY